MAGLLSMKQLLAEHGWLAAAATEELVAVFW
jgi:hypothetical protein